MKLVANTKARHYELTCLVDATYSEVELTAVKEDLAQIVSYHQGAVVESQDWGKRDLAYAIVKGGKRHTEARYLHVIFSAQPTVLTLIERDLHLNEKIMRHLVVVAENGAGTAEKVAEVTPVATPAAVKTTTPTPTTPTPTAPTTPKTSKVTATTKGVGAPRAKSKRETRAKTNQ